MDKDSHYFYVLWCQDETLYGGYARNLSKRLAQHQAGRGAKYTRVKKRRPLHLLYAEEWSSKQEAMSQEYWFKSLSRLKKEAYLRKSGLNTIGAVEQVMVDYRGEEIHGVRSGATN